MNLITAQQPDPADVLAPWLPNGVTETSHMTAVNGETIILDFTEYTITNEVIKGSSSMGCYHPIALFSANLLLNFLA